MAIVLIKHPQNFSHKKIYGKPLWELCKERLSASKEVKEILFWNNERNQLEEIFTKTSEEEVLSIWDAQIFIEPKIVDEVIRLHRDSKADYTYTVGFAQGVSFEVFSRSLILRLLHTFKDEFFDPFIFIKENKELFITKKFFAPLPLWRPKIKLCVYTEEERKEAEEFLSKYKTFDPILYIKEKCDIPWTKKIKDGIKKKLKIKVEDILLLCTGSIELMANLIDALKSLWTKAKIHFLCPKYLCSLFSEKDVHLIPINGESINFSNIPEEVLKDKRYNIVFLPQKEKEEDEHKKIEVLFSKNTNAYIITLSPEGELFLLIKAFEDTEDEHLLVLGARKREKVSGLLQERIYKLKKAGELLILPHPSWIPPHTLFKLKGFDAIEIFTHFDPEPFLSSKNSLKYWDYLLEKGMRIWGIAADDSHSLKERKDAWICIKSKNFTSLSILSAIKKGSFYSSTGPSIEDISVDEKTIYVRLKEEGIVKFLAKGRVLKESFGKEAFYQINGRESYVRFEVVKNGKIAWSQPFFVKGALLSPYEEEGFWFKGNTHCHTARSDGEGRVDEVIEVYKRRGYNFLAITDHELI